ncbi:MAG: ATP-binding protein [Bacteroidales bacterium]|nr:ATP-binding protein [Bacteroidales bacterium]MCF8328053.1 ATP-binding protein [Bacteroidales bacterium]
MAVNKERLKEIMLDQREMFNNQTHLISRDIDLKNYISTGLVVIISGVRRCGKSSLLYLVKEKMKLSQASYCYFNFDDERVPPDKSVFTEILNLHLEMYGQEPVLFFDEVQNIPGWEKFINRIYEQGSKVFVTGSNAKLLSSEISGSLTGRNRVLKLFPFSFSEYLRYIGHNYFPEKLSSKNKALLLKDFNHYLETGGFPVVVKENDTELMHAYFQDILYRDIVARYRLSQVNEIRQIGLYFASNTGKLFSYATLQEVSGTKSTSSVKDYLDYYEQTYLFFFLKKFDFSIRKQQLNRRKVYAVDPAVVHRLGFNFSANKGRVLENIVYLELLRRDKEVYYHSGKYECDFLVKEGLRVISAIQVTYKLHAENYEREFRGLEEAMNTYDLDNGLLLVYELDEDLPVKEGINVVPVWKWLIEAAR